jgi:type I restriction enzyme S subunit
VNKVISELKSFKLRDISKVITGVTPRNEEGVFSNSGINFLTPSDINGFDFLAKTERKLDLKGVTRFNSRVVDYGLAVVCIGATIGKLARITTPTLTNQQINTIVPRNGVVDRDFLFYYFQEMVGNLKMVSGGSATPLLNKSLFESIQVTLPNFLSQQKIGKYLANVDEQIQLHRKIIHDGKQAIELLYRYWFINSKSKLDSRSSESDKEYFVKLGNVIDSINTGLNPRDNFKLGVGRNYYVTIKNIEEGEVILDEKCDLINDESVEFIQNRSKLEVGDTLFTSIEPVGITHFIARTPANWNINESVFSIKPNRKLISPEFLNAVISSAQMKSYTKNVASGSIHKGIRHSDLKRFEFVMPSLEQMDKFTKISKYLHEQIATSRSSIASLEMYKKTVASQLLSGHLFFR